MAVSRLRLKDILDSRAPSVVGVCGSQISQVADLVNSAQERLITCREAGDTGWYGSYAEMVFNVEPDDPYIVCPRGVARLIGINYCDTPVQIWNQFYEYLAFGSGHWPKLSCYGDDITCPGTDQKGLKRNTACTYIDFAGVDYGIRVYSDHADDGLRMLFGCKDSNEQQVFTLDGPLQVNGCFLTLDAPFTDLTLPDTTTALELSEILGIQKDVTTHPVYVYERNLINGTENLILTLDPSETVAAYTKYYLHDLPDACLCGTGDPDTVQIQAMVKLDLVPAVVPTDYLLIQSKEAIIAEMQSIRFSDMDSPNSKNLAMERHISAVRYLQGQLVHYEGKHSPSVSFAPFGRSKLSNQKIGTLI